MITLSTFCLNISKTPSRDTGSSSSFRQSKSVLIAITAYGIPASFASIVSGAVDILIISAHRILNMLLSALVENLGHSIVTTVHF